MNRHSTTRRPRLAACLIVTAGALLIAAPAPAFAQLPGQQRPADAPKQREFKPPLPLAPSNPPSAPLQMILAIGLLGLLCGVSMIPSKRGHQD